MSDDVTQQINNAFKQAVSFHQAGQLEQAASIYRQLLRINPNQADILHLLGLISYQMGVYEESIALIGKAVELQPNISNFHNHLGSALFALGKRDIAMKQFKRAIECPNPTADAYHNLGVALYDAGEWDASIEIYEKGLKHYPEEGLLLNEVLKNMAEACSWGGQYQQYRTKLLDKAKKELMSGKISSLSPYHSLCLEDDATLQQSVATAYAKKIENHVKPARAQLNFNFQKGHKPSGSHHALRIGYVSADFRDHPTAHLMGNMLELHNDKQVETFIYALGEPDESEYRQRIKDSAYKFIEVQNMPLHQVAQQIYNDKIDILIDVMGYISGAQPEIFALKPAPVNVSFLAYPGTMGATFMDYLVTDKVALPDAKQISEMPLFMPDSYFVSDKTIQPHKAKSRSAYGLPETGQVLACFNKPSKITPEMFDVWCELLQELPEAVLWLYVPNEDTQAHLLAEAKARNIDAKRLVFAAKLDKKAHLARYKHVDLFLDCAPVTAHTTAIDALFMGVPLITIYGNSIISRASSSILNALGLEELVCEDLEQYKQKSLALLKDETALVALQSKVRQAFTNHSFFDTELYVKQFEEGLHQAFAHWLNGKKSRPIAL